MKIHHIKLTKAQLEAIPEAERTLLILSAHAANELSTLVKIFHFCSKHEAKTEVEKAFRNAQAMTLGRILTGKLYECWILLQKGFFGARLSKAYEDQFDRQASDALEGLKKYFGKPNLIEAVRNRHAFHYAPDQIAAGFKRVAEQEPLDIYMSETNVNTLYAFADVVAGHALVEDIAAGDIAKGFDSLIVETTRALAWLNQVIAACMLIAIKTYLGKSAEDLGSTEIEVTGVPDWKSVTIPYFVEIAVNEVT
jgi:hypothetical protein